MNGVPALLALAAGLAGCGGQAVDMTTTSTALATPHAVSSGPGTGISGPWNAGTAIDGRYGDGIPRTIDGAPVLRGRAALARARSATDDRPFLVGGWVTYEPGQRICPLRAADDSSWLHDCLRPRFSDAAGAEQPALSMALTFRFVLGGLATGPIVATVEVHDPRASQCGSAVTLCDRLMVVEGIVWSGDTATDPRPLSADALQDILEKASGATALVPVGPRTPRSDCGQALAAARLYVLSLKPTGAPSVALVEVEPSVVARERALRLAEGPHPALGPAALACTAFSRTPTSSSADEYRWLAIGNVVVLVHTHHAPTAADRAFLERLSTVLERAASSG